MIAIERKMNKASDEMARADLRALPSHLDRIDEWILDGTLAGAEEPNAADLQIAASLRLLSTIGDVRPRCCTAGPPTSARGRCSPTSPATFPPAPSPAGWLPQVA